MNKISSIAVAAIISGIMLSCCGSSKRTTAVSVTDQKEMHKQVGVPAEVAIDFSYLGIDFDVEFLRINGTSNGKDSTMAKKTRTTAHWANWLRK